MSEKGLAQDQALQKAPQPSSVGTKPQGAQPQKTVEKGRLYQDKDGVVHYADSKGDRTWDAGRGVWVGVSGIDSGVPVAFSHATDGSSKTYYNTKTRQRWDWNEEKQTWQEGTGSGDLKPDSKSSKP